MQRSQVVDKCRSASSDPWRSASAASRWPSAPASRARCSRCSRCTRARRSRPAPGRRPVGRRATGRRAHKMVQLYVSQLRKALADGGDGGGDRHARARVRAAPRRRRPRRRRFEQLISDGHAARGARRCGAARRSPTWRTSRSPAARSAASRSCGCGRSSWRSTAIWRMAGTARSSASSRRVAAEEPLRERLHAQRMLALYRSGRQADALEAYRDFRARARRGDRGGARPGPAPAARGDPAPGPRARAARRRHAPSCRRSWTPAPRWWAARRSSPRCASTGGDAHGGAGRLVVDRGRARHRQDAPRGRARRRAAPRPRDRALRLGRRCTGDGTRRGRDRARRAAADAAWCSTTSTAPATQLRAALDGPRRRAAGPAGARRRRRAPGPASAPARR